MTLFASLILVAGVGARQFPVPPAFSASIQTHHQTFSQDYRAGPAFTGGQVKMDFSSQSQSWEFYYDRFAWISPVFGNLSLKQVVVNGEPSMSDSNGTVCGPRVNPHLGTVISLLDQMPEAGSFDGTSSVFDVACDIWTVRDNSTGNLSVCIDHEGVPRSMIAESLGDRWGWANIGVFSYNVTFHDIATGDDANVGAIEPLSCWINDMTNREDWICQEPVRHRQVLRGMSDPEPLGILENRDTFDWVGQGVTLGAANHSSFAGQQYLEIFDVDVDGRLGFWRDCNYNRDLGKNVCDDSLFSAMDYDKLITRTSAELLQGEKLMGMCEANSLVGSWLTFPEEGKCAESAWIGDDGCTWKLASAKVILMECMKAFNSSGWERAWEIDYSNAPFPNVMAHVQAAVEACPDARENILSV